MDEFDPIPMLVTCWNCGDLNLLLLYPQGVTRERAMDCGCVTLAEVTQR